MNRSWPFFAAASASARNGSDGNATRSTTTSTSLACPHSFTYVSWNQLS